jgi:hypothetical protein
MMPSDLHAKMLETADLATRTDSDGKLHFTRELDRRKYVGIRVTYRLPTDVRRSKTWIQGNDFTWRSKLSVLPERKASLDVRARTSIVIGGPS